MTPPCFLISCVHFLEFLNFWLYHWARKLETIDMRKLRERLLHSRSSSAFLYRASVHLTSSTSLLQLNNREAGTSLPTCCLITCLIFCIHLNPLLYRQPSGSVRGRFKCVQGNSGSTVPAYFAYFSQGPNLQWSVKWCRTIRMSRQIKLKSMFATFKTWALLSFFKPHDTRFCFSKNGFRHSIEDCLRHIHT